MSDPSDQGPDGMVPLLGGQRPTTVSSDRAVEMGLEARLMRAVAQNQDRVAFAELYERYAPKIKSFVLRLGADGMTADEVVQESMIAVWRRAETFDKEKASVSTWLFTIARNKRYDLIRRSQRPIPDPADPAFEIQGEIPQDEKVDMSRRQDRVRAAIAVLPAEQAELVRLSFFEGKAHSTIADELDLPLGTVKSRVRLALGKLRKVMESERDA